MRNILLATFLTIVVITAVSYTACNKNKCASVVCQSRGVCNNGNCVCPVGISKVTGARCSAAINLFLPIMAEIHAATRDAGSIQFTCPSPMVIL